VYHSIDFLLLVHYTLPDSCYILCMSYCIDLLACLLLVVHGFLVTIYIYYFFLVYMTWIPDILLDTCTCCSLILLCWG